MIWSSSQSTPEPAKYKCACCSTPLTELVNIGTMRVNICSICIDKTHIPDPKIIALRLAVKVAIDEIKH